MATTRYEGNVSSTANDLLPLGVRENGRFSTRNCVNPVGLAAGTYLIAEWITDPQDPTGSVQLATDAAGVTFIRRSSAYPSTWATWQTTSGGAAGVTSWQGAVGPARTGAVVAQAGDYTSTMATNLSGVAGATVTDALNTLNAGVGAVNGANLGTGTGTVFASKVGSTLNFNSLQGTLNGLTVSAPVGNTITIDNTLSGTNLGAGSQVFSSKNGSNLEFRSIVAGEGISAVQNASDVTISSDETTWIFYDTKNSGIPGGGSAPGLNTRTIINGISSGPSVANVTQVGNTLVFQPGRYHITASAPAFGADAHQLIAFNDTSGAILISGTSEFASSAILAAQTRSFIEYPFMTAVPLTVRFDHFITTGKAVNGLGVATSTVISNELYLMVHVCQLG